MIDSALMFTERSCQYAIDEKDILLQRENALLQQRIFEQKKDFSKAYKKAIIYKRLNDSINIEIKIKDVYNYKHQIADIKYDKKLLLKEKEIESQRIKLIFAIIIGLLSSFFGVVFFIKRNQKSKANKFLV